MRNRLGAAALLATLLVTGACSSSKKSSSSATTVASATTAPAATTSTTASVPKLTILVTNDDGFNAPGINTLVVALLKLPNVDVKVVAPATNESGTGSKTTAGTLIATQVKTQGGYPAVAVKGYPADTVRYAFDTLHIKPDVVVAGVNFGQNVGPLIDVSGTVGAARAGAARGVPAVASSQGLGTPVQFQVTAAAVVKWLTTNRSKLQPDTGSKAGTVTNINGPSCAAGLSPRGTITLPPAPAGTAGVVSPTQNCASTATPTNDVEGLNEGYIVVDTIPLAPGTGG
ncbi:MAG TPA: 5'/3'-nucleotidase SurE [Acidimicrobiales bacterium]